MTIFLIILGAYLVGFVAFCPFEGSRRWTPERILLDKKQKRISDYNKSVDLLWENYHKSLRHHEEYMQSMNDYTKPYRPSYVPYPYKPNVSRKNPVTDEDYFRARRNIAGISICVSLAWPALIAWIGAVKSFNVITPMVARESSDYRKRKELTKHKEIVENLERSMKVGEYAQS